MKKVIQERVVPIIIVVTVAIAVGGFILYKGSQKKNIETYFVSTNPVYTERYEGNLAEMAINLNFFDFDALVEGFYPLSNMPICTPIEATDGSTTYYYSFKTQYWQVDLSTLVDNETCLVTSWINLYQLNDFGNCYEYQSQSVRMKPSNYVTNLSADGITRLFLVERETFANFLMLIKTDALSQTVAVPFEMAQVPYQKTQPLSLDPAT